MSAITDTKSKILDVAEILFADAGVDRVSIRDITERAQVNIAAVNYHFGGKDELIAAVFERRIGPVNDARLQAMERLEQSAGSRTPKIEEVLEAFIRPALVCCAEGRKGGEAFAKLFGRCLAEPHPSVETLLQRQFQPLVDKLDGLILKALPQLPRSEVFWRMKFTFGALHHWLLTRDRFLPPWAEETSVEDQMKKLVAFAAAGFKAKSLADI